MASRGGGTFQCDFDSKAKGRDEKVMKKDLVAEFACAYWDIIFLRGTNGIDKFDIGELRSGEGSAVFVGCKTTVKDLSRLVREWKTSAFRGLLMIQP